MPFLYNDVVKSNNQIFFVNVFTSGDKCVGIGEAVDCWPSQPSPKRGRPKASLHDEIGMISQYAYAVYPIKYVQSLGVHCGCYSIS